MNSHTVQERAKPVTRNPDSSWEKNRAAQGEVRRSRA